MNNPKSIFTAPRDFTKQPADISTLPHAPPLDRRRSTPDARVTPQLPNELDANRPLNRSLPNLLSRHHSFLGHNNQSLVERQSWKPSASSSQLAGQGQDQDQDQNQAHSPHFLPPTSRDPPRTPRTTGKKRSLTAARAGESKEPSSEPSRKSIRLERPRHTLNRFSFSNLNDRKHEPPSPLFFSHSPRPRPLLPPRFSSSEAAASMMTKAKEVTGMKTVHLARGVLGGGSPPSASRQSIDRASVDTTSTPSALTPEQASDQEDATRVLSQIGISELLEQDERPTFIVDLKDPSNSVPGYLQIVFANSSLRTCSGMLELVTNKDEVNIGSNGGSSGTTWPQFKAWLLSASNLGESLNVCLPSLKFAGILWSCSTLRKRLRIASGRCTSETVNNTPVQSSKSRVASITSPSQAEVLATTNLSPLETKNHEPSDYFGNAVPAERDMALPEPEKTDVAPSIENPGGHPLDALNGAKSKSDSAISEALISNPSAINEYVLRAATAGNVDHFHSPEQRQAGFFDWTRLPDSADLPQHVQFARSIDWASTSLGPLETWSADLRQMSNLIMASPHPAAMYWGSDLVAIYNEAYVLLAGQKHPVLMGQPYSEAWAEIWDEVKDVFANARTTGEATMKVSHLKLPNIPC